MSTPQKQTQQNIFGLLKPYKWWVLAVVILTVGSNALNLIVPKIISGAIDSYSTGNFVFSNIAVEFSVVILSVLILVYVQNIVQNYTAEIVARDLRKDIFAKISLQQNSYIQAITPAKLLTNLTSDVNAIKTFVSQAIASIISSIFLIIGASFLLISIDWRLALSVLIILPIVATTFYLVLARIRKLFTKAQEAIDWLNKVINESILGAGLIRLLNSHQQEYEKFLNANTEAKNVSLNILRLFASIIPVIVFSTNLGTFIILTLGGKFVIDGTMTIGNFTAFNSYLSILIFPIIIIGFMSNAIAQADASYKRIREVLEAEVKESKGKLKITLNGDVEMKDVSMVLGDKKVLDNISFEVKSGTRTAIIGPTAAGKTQLLYLLTGLTTPTSGIVEYDNKDIDDYDKTRLHEQIGFVFQDSILFNLTLRENIAFSNTVNDEDLKKAIDTAELGDFIDSLPLKLDTIVSERGTSLSGGQKQRVMLARALAINPKILLLDDFTARVDNQTERKILKNVRENYPNITLISVTQKIAPIEDYDQIILLMEGEIIAKGTHKGLMRTSTEYVQIYDSQKSTNNYELQA